MDKNIKEIDIIQHRYIDILSKVDSSLFRGLDLSKILFNETFYCTQLCNIETKKLLIKRLFLLPSIIKSTIDNHDLLCIYSKNYRKDHDDYWERICKDAGVHDKIIILNRSRSLLDIIKRIDLLGISKRFRWYKIATKELYHIENLSHRRYLALQMVARKGVLEHIARLSLHPKAVMCFFDSSPDENVLMQYFRIYYGAITITNQHGLCVFKSREYDRLNQSQILNFKCNFFFAKGEMQKKQFALAGIDRERIRIIGAVGISKYEYNINNNKIIGVFLDYPFLPSAEKNNGNMISIVKNTARMLGYRYYIKTHPTDSTVYYKKLIDDNCVGLFGRDTEVETVLKKTEVSLVHSSATYVDSYLNGIRCFKYVTEVSNGMECEEDRIYSDSDFYQNMLNWNAKDLNEKKDYILLVQKQFDGGWRQYKVRDTIKDLCYGIEV